MSARSSPAVLITGAAGFLGSHLCEHFLARDWRVLGIDNLLTGVGGNLAHLGVHAPGGPEVQLQEGGTRIQETV